jgi:hypothetical protein
MIIEFVYSTSPVQYCTRLMAKKSDRNTMNSEYLIYGKNIMNTGKIIPTWQKKMFYRNTMNTPIIMKWKNYKDLTYNYIILQSHITTDSQSASLSWCRTPPGAYDQKFDFSDLNSESYSPVYVGALSDERLGLSFVIVSQLSVCTYISKKKMYRN